MYVVRLAVRYCDAGVFLQQLTNGADTLSFRERVFDVRPQSPDLTGCRLRLSPALFGEAVAGFSGPVLSLISFFGLLHRAPHRQGGGRGISEQPATKKDKK
jgi:hypothetical protein